MGPGHSVELVLNLDLVKETIDVRKSLIYDVEGNQYILSQTTPSVKRYDVGKPIHLTHLRRQGDRYARLGFMGRLTDLIRDYQLHSSQSVQALRVKQLSSPNAYDLRMYYRIRPGAEWPFRFEIMSHPLQVVDISLGGAAFSLSSSDEYEPAQAVEILCHRSDGDRHSILARIKRVWFPPRQIHGDRKFVAVQFLQKDMNLKKELEREILQVQRGALFKN